VTACANVLFIDSDVMKRKLLTSDNEQTPKNSTFPKQLSLHGDSVVSSAASTLLRSPRSNVPLNPPKHVSGLKSAALSSPAVHRGGVSDQQKDAASSSRKSSNGAPCTANIHHHKSELTERVKSDGSVISAASTAFRPASLGPSIAFWKTDHVKSGSTLNCALQSPQPNCDVSKKKKKKKKKKTVSTPQPVEGTPLGLGSLKKPHDISAGCKPRMFVETFTPYSTQRSHSAAVPCCSDSKTTSTECLTVKSALSQLSSFEKTRSVGEVTKPATFMPSSAVSHHHHAEEPDDGDDMEIDDTINEVVSTWVCVSLK